MGTILNYPKDLIIPKKGDYVKIVGVSEEIYFGLVKQIIIRFGTKSNFDNSITKPLVIILTNDGNEKSFDSSFVREIITKSKFNIVDNLYTELVKEHKKYYSGITTEKKNYVYAPYNVLIDIELSKLNININKSCDYERIRILLEKTSGIRKIDNYGCLYIRKDKLKKFVRKNYIKFFNTHKEDNDLANHHDDGLDFSEGFDDFDSLIDYEI